MKGLSRVIDVKERQTIEQKHTHTHIYNLKTLNNYKWDSFINRDKYFFYKKEEEIVDVMIQNACKNKKLYITRI